MNQSASSNPARALRGALAGVLDAPSRIAVALAGALAQRASGGCDIPPPCWEPRPAGTCCLDLTPGGTSTIRVHVSNCGWTRQVVSITALGKMAGWMTFSPTTLILDAMERATFQVIVQAPNTVKAGERFSAPLIIRGCVDHFVRVDVTVTDCAGTSCCDVAVKDCADNIHHWYDHFYCPRPCRTIRTPDAREVKDG